jgi:peptidyl-prolyl cis-trans isomerase SurA
MSKPAFPPRLVRLAAALVGAWLVPPLAAAAPQQASPIDRIQIVVNDEVVTAREVDDRIRLVKARLAAQNLSAPPDATLRRQVMERIAVERLQLQVATQRGITVSDDQLQQAIRRIAEQQHKTVDQLKQEVEGEPGGYRGFLAELRTQITIQQLVEREVQSRVFVSDAEVENYLAGRAAQGGSEEYNLSHILITVPEKASAEAIAAARTKADALHGELENGADFAQLAVANSQGQNALEGGGLGWRAAGELPDLFVSALRNLKPGQVSAVLRSPNGFHILRLNDRRGGDTAVNVTQTRARHILIKISELVPPAEALRRAAQLRERLLAGQDFAELARANSDDIGSAADGGDLGWMNPGQTVPEFENAMNALKPGELSTPVRSPFGVHLIQVLERRSRDIGQEREIARARNQIHARKAEERYEQWLRQLRDEAFVEYRSDSGH